MAPATILVGEREALLERSESQWKERLLASSPETRRRLAFMTRDHHRIRNFAVRRLGEGRGPLSVELIAEQLGLESAAVEAILGELDRGLFFLVLDGQGRVTWAFPFSSEETPHAVALGGERPTWGAWAEDALAAPFVQGHLTQQPIAGRIESSCVCCDTPVLLSVTSDLEIAPHFEGGQRGIEDLLLFVPSVDWSRLSAPTIVPDYWTHCVFLWSEEHARVHRQTTAWPDGLYLNLDQAALMVRVAQSALFAMD